MKPLSILFILLAVFWVFSPCLDNDFVYWDDRTLIEENPQITPLSLYNIKQIFTSFHIGTYIPLTILSFAIEYHFVQAQPFLYHLNNVLLHLAVIFSIYVFVQRLGLSRNAAAFACLLFGLHPLNVESVAWVAERKDVLFMLFYILSLNYYVGFVKFRNKGAYLWALLFGVLSIFSKPMAYSLPMVLFVCDYLLGLRISKKSLLQKAPFILIIGLVAIASLQHSVTVVKYPLSQCILVWIYAFVFYLFKFIYPFDLNVIYPMPQPISLWEPAYFIGTVCFAVFVTLLVRYRKNRCFLAAVLFYALTIAVVVVYAALDFGSNTVLADRFMYLPKLAFCLLFAAGLERAWKRWNGNKIFLRASSAIIVICLFLLSVKTFSYCQVWKNDVTLWSYVIKQDPAEATAYINRARAYVDQKKFDLALWDYRQAQELEPENPKVFLSTGSAYYKMQAYDLAQKFYAQALALDPDYAHVYFHLASMYADMGQHERAIETYTKHLALQPDNPKAYYNLGLLYDGLKQPRLAIENFSRAIALDPRYSAAWNNRGFIYLKQDRLEPALNDFINAIRQDDKNALAYNNRGTLYLRLKKYHLAAQDFYEACRIDPHDITAAQNLIAVQKILEQQ